MAKTLAQASDDFSAAIGEVRALSDKASDALLRLGYTSRFYEQTGDEFTLVGIDTFEKELPEILAIIKRERESERRCVERLEALTARVRAALRGEEVTP
jgi:hypothetical protein